MSDIDDIDQNELSNFKDYFNIILIGDSSVGKTSILEKYVNNTFNPELQNKKIIEIYKKNIYLYTNLYKLKFWDITKFIGKHDTPELDMFNNCDGIIFVSSYDNKASLENLNIWYQLLIQHVDLSMKEIVQFINKKDLKEGKVLTKELIDKKSKDLQLDYFEVSAKTGENIEYGIKNVVKKIIQRYNDNDNENNNLIFDASTVDSIGDNDFEDRKKCNIF